MSVTIPLLPSIVRTSQGLDCCGCSMCYNQETDAPIIGVGPHDLHCLCGWCFSTPCTERQCDEQFAQRYPEHFTFDPEDYDDDVEEFSLTNSQIERILEDTFYHPPSTSPTNHDMHAYNGNHGHLGSDMVHPEVTTTYDHTYHNPLNPFKIPAKVSQFVHNLKHDYNVYQHQKIDAEAKDFKLKELAKYNLSRKAKNNLQKLEQITGVNTPGSEEQKNLLDRWIHEIPRDTPPEPDHTPKPDNKSMHIANGNRKMGPITLKQFERKERRKIKRKEKKILKKVKSKPTKITIAKSSAPPRAVKAAAKMETKEQILARRYSSFLKNPVYEPPRLGSTGNNPTKVLQGYQEITVSNATAAGGAAGSDFIAFLSPKMFMKKASANQFISPVTYGFAKDSATTFADIASSSATTCSDFVNYQPLANEAGVANRTSDNTLTRYLGGHISIKVKCPQMSVAPPTLFAGMLNSQPGLNGGTGDFVNSQAQLNQLTTTQIRLLKSTHEMSGMEASAVYLPGSAKDLEFNNYITDGSGNYIIPNMPIPYVGYTGCPTTGTTVTIICTAWYEIMQNQNNCNYSGWRLGPKLSTEDVFDHIPRSIVPYSSKCRSIATKGNSSMSSASQILSFIQKPDSPRHLGLTELKEQMLDLKQQFQKLSVLLQEEDEQEQYVTTSPPDTPIQSVNLSQSTINLALALKDRLTPGSVTSKTAKISLP